MHLHECTANKELLVDVSSDLYLNACLKLCLVCWLCGCVLNHVEANWVHQLGAYLGTLGVFVAHATWGFSGWSGSGLLKKKSGGGRRAELVAKAATSLSCAARARMPRGPILV